MPMKHQNTTFEEDDVLFDGMTVRELLPHIKQLENVHAIKRGWSHDDTEAFFVVSIEQDNMFTRREVALAEQIQGNN